MNEFSFYLLITPERTYEHCKPFSFIKPINKGEIQLKIWRLIQINLKFLSTFFISRDKFIAAFLPRTRD